MCCYANRQEKEDFLARMKKRRRKTFIAWKVVYSDGKSAVAFNYQYSPGVHTSHVSENTYKTGRPRGIHVYMYRPPAGSKYTVTIPVQCHVDDLVIMDRTVYRQEAVLIKVKIRKKDWIEAGIPIKKGESCVA